MALSFLWAFRRLLELAVLRFREDFDRDVELIVLRHEVAVLRRQVTRPGLFFIVVGSGRVHLGGGTTNPSGRWVTQQARNLTADLRDRGRDVRFVVRDRDTKFTGPFDEVFASEGATVIRTPYRSPQANYAERFVGTAGRECLDRILILNHRHLERVLREFIRHCNEHWPHRSLDQRPPCPRRSVPTSAGTVRPRPPRRSPSRVRPSRLIVLRDHK